MCPKCEQALYQRIRYDEPPAFIALSICNITAEICTKVTLPDYPDWYRLCGLIYFGRFHFTCHVVDSHGNVWFHDGMKTGNDFVPGGNVQTWTPTCSRTQVRGVLVYFPYCVSIPHNLPVSFSCSTAHPCEKKTLPILPGVHHFHPVGKISR